MELVNKIILSIPFYSKSQFQTDFQEIDLNFPFKLIEIRWDYFHSKISGDLAKWVIKYVHSFNMKAIFTYRGSNTNFNEHHLLLNELISFKPDYIDLDVDIIASQLTELVDFSIKNDVMIVYSYHNDNETPPLPILSDMFEFFIQMLPGLTSREGNILKMVCTAKNTEDNETIIQFCDQFSNLGIDLISFCMGEMGKSTRIKSIQHGAVYTYAYIREPTAAGQIHFSDIL